MMILQLIAFEVSYHSKQIAFRFAVATYLLLGLVCSTASFGGPEVFSNSPYTLSFAFIVLSLGSPILLALLTGNAVLRDIEFRMAPLIFTTEITRAQFLLSRFLGLVTAALLAFLPTIFGLLIGYSLPGRNPAEIGPFLPTAYLWLLTFIILPNVLLCAAFTFATAALSKNASATYVSGIFIYFLYSFGSMLGNSPLETTKAAENSGLGILLDPYGFVGFLEQTRYWTASEKNSQLIALEGHFLLNRLLWLGTALLVFNLTSMFFNVPKTVNKIKAAKIPKRPVNFTSRSYRSLATQTASFSYFWRSLLSQSWLQFRLRAFTLPSAAFSLLWIFFLISTLQDSLVSNDLNTALIPTTALLLEPVYSEVLFFCPMVLLFYAAEVLWQERQVRMAPILDSFPSPTSHLFAAKLIALMGLICSFLIATLALTLVFQASHPAPPIQWLLVVMFAIKAGSTLLFLGIFGMVIMNFVPQKYGALALGFIATALLTPYLLPGTLGPSHPMLQFAYTPEFHLSALLPTSYHHNASLWYAGYWAAISGLMALFLLRFWRRGHYLGRTNHHPAFLAMIGLFAFALIGCGGVIVSKTHHDPTLWSKKARQKRDAAYEKQYQFLKELSQPQLKAVRLHADFYPSQKQYDIRAQLRFVNHQKQPIETLFLTLPTQVTESKLFVGRGRLVESDPKFHVYQYRFPQALQPGEGVMVLFQAQVQQSSFKPLNPENYITPQASYVEFEQLLPQVGLVAGQTITDPSLREKYQLPIRREALPAHEAETIKDTRITFDILASTITGQTVVAPGFLEREWHDQGRRYFAFKSNRPVPLALNLASAPFQKLTQTTHSLPVTYYFHPLQKTNAKEVSDTAITAISYGHENFGPYQGKGLTVATLPSFSHKFAGTACPDTVYLVENRALTMQQAPALAYGTAKILAHEISHQWWGMQLNPAEVEGVTMLLESLAVYSEQVMIQANYSSDDLLNYLKHASDQYFLIRNFERAGEKPLLKVTSQPSIYYFKGALVAHTLRQLLGEPAMNQILNSFLKEHPYPKAVVAKDLLTSILEQAKNEDRAFIKELFTDIVTYQFELTEAASKPIENNSWQITFTLKSQKQTNHDTPQPGFSRPLEVGFFFKGELVKIESVIPSRALQNFRFISQDPVDEVIVDPRYLLLEAVRDNNSKKTDNLLFDH